MANIANLIAANTRRFETAVVTGDLGSVPARLVAAKSRYLAVERATSVPWWAVAIIHELECSQDWALSLAQGDPWDEVSTHVPAGRGPFASWEAAAIDALMNCEPRLGHRTWATIGLSLTNFEEENGLGYADGPVTIRDGVETHYPPQPSPYIWARTNQYRSGKYVADHVYSPTAISKQIGCAALLLGMMKLDPSISIGDQPVAKPEIALSKPASTPVKRSWLSRLAGWFGGSQA